MVGSRRIDMPSWDSYVRAPVDQEVFDSCRQTCGPALVDQHARIKMLVERLNPRRIACLGAGYLNDIPLKTLVAKGRESYLVDFVPNICSEGVRGSIIDRDAEGVCSCMFCHLEAPQEHCEGFSLPIVGQGTVYLSVELFRSLPASERYFLVQGTAQVMEILSRYFFFDFHLIPPSDTLRSTKISSGTSIIESFVLTPRDDL